MAILIIAALAAAAFVVVQRQRGGTAALGRPSSSQLERDPGYYGAPHRDPAYGNGATGAAYDPASSANHPDPHRDGAIDPVTGERIDGYGDPDTDPRYDDPRYDGRLAADYDPDPRPDDRVR